MLDVRRATATDAAGVVAALRRAEGGSHFDPRFYDVVALAQAWRARSLRSWIAVDGEGTIRGHGALSFGAAAQRSTGGDVVEYGHAFTDPEFRHRGAAAAVGAAALTWAAEHDVAEIYAWALTVRPYAQLALRAAGAEEICLLLAMSPAGVNRGFDRDIAAPVAAMLYVLRLQVDTGPRTWHLPEPHRAVVAELMSGTSVAAKPLATTRTAETRVSPTLERPVEGLTTEYVARLRFGVIDVAAPYPEVQADIAAAHEAFVAAGANVTYLDLDPTDPRAMALVEPLSCQGFAFAGIHPNYITGQLRFRLQRLACAVQPRDTIATISARGAALLDHVWATLPRELHAGK